ncbi:ABC transporter permease [Erythrobacter crassostreae]|uniref:ABC transporter permease n=1 Tax=Erythrobacter crassostreae TaxID=2828328 RepID=A0A9X1F542_9SPHN|nr:ABC transporter permease [Erythrobacter crassostrea]MBV7260312.1 ABC transporter permease [Erythrobacter crassostrea]
MHNSTLVVRNLLHNKLRTALLCIAVASSFLLFGLLASFHFSALNTDTSGSDRLIVANKISFTQPLPISYYEQVAQTEGVDAATHSTWFGGYYREPSNFIVSFAIDFESYFDVFSELEIAPSDLQKCSATRDGIAVGQAMADALGWQRGDRIGLNSAIFMNRDGGRTWEFEICGFFSDTNERGADNAVYFGFEYLNETRNLGVDTIGLVTLTPQSPDRNAKIINAIDTRYTNSPAETETVTEQQFAASFAQQFGDLRLIIALVVGCSFLTSLIIVGTTMASVIRSRTRELGLLKTLGFSDSSIVRLLLGETLAIALIGGAAGLFLAQVILLLAGQYADLGGIDMRWQVWATGMIFVLLLGLVTAVTPSITALRLTILEALGRR